MSWGQTASGSLPAQARKTPLAGYRCVSSDLGAAAKPESHHPLNEKRGSVRSLFFCYTIMD